MPSNVEDYEILHTIGSGSYARCQKIRRKSDAKVMVWKELDYGTMTESEKQMLVSEVNLLRELRHPNIVRYYDRIIDRPNKTLYIVMEYCDGGDLSSLITRCIKERRHLEEEFILQILAQLALALKECHRRRDGKATVLHRDLKPANIFLDSNQNVKLGDFGLARVLNNVTSFAKTFVGTPYYMSPEQMDRRFYNEKSDIWSLGCLLYELCALSPPFTAYNQRLLAERIREGRFKRIPSRYSEKLNSLISRMLNVTDYLRPSVDGILFSSLLSGAVAEEEKKVQLQPRRKSVDTACKPEESSSALALELKLRQQALRDREQAIKEREERLEKREMELCVRELQSKEKLERVESLIKKYDFVMQRRAQIFEKDLDDQLSASKRKVHCPGEVQENQHLYSWQNVTSQELRLKRFQTSLKELETICQIKSKQNVGICSKQ